MLVFDSRSISADKSRVSFHTFPIRAHCFFMHLSDVKIQPIVGQPARKGQKLAL